MRLQPTSGTGVAILIAIGIAAILVIATIGMWLWNWLMPMIFGLPTIGIWEFLGLSVLTSLLFYRG